METRDQLCDRLGELTRQQFEVIEDISASEALGKTPAELAERRLKVIELNGKILTLVAKLNNRSHHDSINAGDSSISQEVTAVVATTVRPARSDLIAEAPRCTK